MAKPRTPSAQRPAEPGGAAERRVVILESLLPDPAAALQRLLEKQATQGAPLAPHWRLSAKDIGAGAHEVRFEPAGPANGDPSLLASGSFGGAPVEVSLGLAHATAAEAEAFQQTLRNGAPFRVIVLSHEVDP